MNSLKKIFTTTMLMTNLIALACDDNHKSDAARKKREQQYALEREQDRVSTAIFAGVLGAVAGTALGYFVGSYDAAPESAYCPVERFDTYQPELLSPKARQVKMKLDCLAKYGQFFTIQDYCGAGISCTIAEQEIITNLYKLGIRLDQIDSNFYSNLAHDHKVLSDAGYSIWWHGLENLERQKDLYLSNSNKLIAYFNRHQDFIRGCQIINYYYGLSAEIYNSPTIMIYPPVLPAWVYAQVDHCHQYPLIAFTNKVEADQKALMRLQRYAGQYILQARCATQRILNHVLDLLYNSYAYQQEVDRKRQDELLAEYNRIEQERLQIARNQARICDEANRLAAERNKIERDRNNNYRDKR